MKYEILPDKNFSKKDKKKPISLYKYNKVGKHTTKNGKGCVGRLIRGN